MSHISRAFGTSCSVPRSRVQIRKSNSRISRRVRASAWLGFRHLHMAVGEAASHFAPALSIFIKLGFNLIAHTQSNVLLVNTARSLNHALVLIKRLESVTIPTPKPRLSAEDNRLLNFVIPKTAKTEYAAPPELPVVNGKHLSAAVVRFWAKAFPIV